MTDLIKQAINEAAKAHQGAHPIALAVALDSETLFRAYLMSAKKAECPTCKAKPVDPCIFGDKPREDLVHRTRKS
jgi:hypothetical protein